MKSMKKPTEKNLPSKNAATYSIFGLVCEERKGVKFNIKFLLYCIPAGDFAVCGQKTFSFKDTDMFPKEHFVLVRWKKETILIKKEVTSQKLR